MTPSSPILSPAEVVGWLSRSEDHWEHFSTVEMQRALATITSLQSDLTKVREERDRELAACIEEIETMDAYLGGKMTAAEALKLIRSRVRA